MFVKYVIPSYKAQKIEKNCDGGDKIAEVGGKK
jgi:hypothetical protein